MANTRVIIVNENDDIRITVPGQEDRTCVYISLEDGKLVIGGGAGIIKRIEGESMLDRIRENKKRR